MKRMYDVEKGVAILYLVLIFAKRFVVNAKYFTLLGSNAFPLVMLVQIAGLLIWIAQGGRIRLNKSSKGLFNVFFFVVITLISISLFDSVHYYEEFGTMYGETTFNATVGQIVYWLIYLSMVVYNIRVVALLSYEKIWGIIEKISVALLVIGYVQIIVLLAKNAIVDSIYNAVFWKVFFASAEEIHNLQRISLSTVEPAYAGYYLTRIVLPVLLAKLLTEKKRRYWIYLILWIPVIYFVKSTSMFLILGVELVTFIIVALMVQIRNREWRISKYLCVAMLALPIVIIAFVIKYPDKVQQLLYYAIYKVNDSSNMSTAMRIAPISINWEIFKRYPILGVGNGSQGFFYWEFFPEWALESLKGTVTFATMQTEMQNGTLFLPSIISGYGLVGTILLIAVFITGLRVMKQYKDRNYIEYLVYVIAIPAIIVNGFSADFVGQYDVWFTLTIPFTICRVEDLNGYVSKVGEYNEIDRK